MTDAHLRELAVQVFAGAARGTGFFAGPGQVLTCAHVVRDAKAVRVVWKGKNYDATIERMQPERWDATTAIIPDIALLRIPFRDHPHAEIDGNCDPTDELYGWAYPVTRDTGDSFQGACEGPDGSGLIKFRDTVIAPGMSGAPILNLRTGKVCGMLKVTRDKDRPSGGRAVSGGMLQRFLSPPPNEADFLEGLPTRWASQVDAFLVQYLGTASSPAPFGGRQKDLEELDAWLGDESAARYGLLEARGGLGKSALLAHWIHRLGENGAACGLVYFPISARWRTNSESALFESLGFRLASLFGETGPRSQDLRELRDVFKKYLARAGAESRRLLLVVDGLDEAAGWQAGTDLFPPTSRGNVRILVAARPIGEGARGWLGKLGWNTAGVVKRFHLNGLDRTGLADVLQRMGDPLAPLAARLNLVNLLAEKSDGDPLLVGLYVNKWRDYVDDPQTFDVRRMQQIEPGLAGFFQYWLDDQIELWGEARHEREPRVRTLMTLCALAHGPLTQEDVQGLAPDMFGSRRAVEDAAHDLRRLVIGDGRNQGYTFGHPRLGVFIREEKLEERELRQYEQRFLSYGSEVIDAFQRGQRSKVPDYVVRWRSTHLTDARRPCVEYRPLLNASWCREWERVDGTPAGFLGDLEKAWQSARGPAECGVRLRISLLRASVRTPGRGVTQELFVQCVSEGIISPTLAEVIARQQASPRDVCGYLVAIANGDDRERLLEAALSVVGQVWDEGGREYALRGVVERLGTEDGKLLQRALVIARKMRDNRERAEALKGVGEKLPPGDREEVLEEALAAARKLEHESYRAWALSAISDAYSIRRVELLEEILALAGGARDRVNVLNSAVSRMTPDDRPLLRAALAVVRQMPDDEHRRFMLCEVSNQFGSGDEDLLAETLTVAREIKDEWSRAWSLSVLAQKLRPSDRAKVWTEALVAAQEEQDERKRAHVLAEMAELLRPDDGDLLHGILTLMDRLHGNERTRAGAYTLVAERLGPCDREKALAKALETARQIENAYRPGALLAIADLLAPSDREGLLAEALATARQIEKNDERAKALLAVARRSDAERREERILEALAAVRQLIAAPRESYDRRVDVLNAVLTQLAPEETELLQGVLRTAREIGEQLEVVEALSSVARKMEGQDGEKVLEEALAVARRISDEGARARAFSAVAERLGAADRRKVLGEAVKTACQIGDESARATALSAVVEKLTPLDGELVQEAVSAGRQMEDGTAKAKALGAVAEKLGRKDRQNALGEALQAASQIPRERERRYALSEVVEKLSAEDRELLQLALRTARQIADGGLRAEALSDVAERSGVADLFHEALESARKDDYLDRHTLSRIAGRLGASDREFAREVLAMTRELEDLAKTERGGEIGNVDVLWALLKHMKPEDREWADEILTLAREMGNELSRARALVLLVKRFPVGDRKMVFKEALAAVRDLPYEGERAAGLGDLAAVSDPEDKEKIFEEALAVIRQIDDEDTLEEALRCVASDLGASDQKFLDLVRAEAPRVNNPIRRARVLSIIAAQSDSRSVAGFAESLLDIADEPGILGMLPSLAARWADFCRFRKSTPSDELGLWLERLSRGSRPHLIDAMRALIPAIEEVGGQTALSEMVLAMADTGLSWP